MMDNTVSYHDHEVVDILANMLRQERDTYRRNDYLAKAVEFEDGIIDSCWRQRMIEWMYGVIDHCNLRRESVVVATHFLDLAACRGLVRSRRDFQLISMTSLMLSIKLNDSTSVKLDSMVRLGKGLFSETDVLKMEMAILKVMNWQVHPPTTLCFTRQLLRFLPAETSPVARYLVVELTRFIAEVSVCLYPFIKYDSSITAIAGIVISLERVDESTFPHELREQFLNHIFAITGIDNNSECMTQAVQELRSSFDNNVNLKELMRGLDQQCKLVNHSPESKPKDVEMQYDEPHSPRDVSSDHLR